MELEAYCLAISVISLRGRRRIFNRRYPRHKARKKRDQGGEQEGRGEGAKKNRLDGGKYRDKDGQQQQKL